MEIKRFSSINEAKVLSNPTKEYLKGFNDAVDTDIFHWISDISKGTKVDEYTWLLGYKVSSITDKKFDTYKEYTDCFREKMKLEKEYEKKLKILEKEEDKLFWKASSEVMFKFQEDLLNKDFDNFYKFFIEDSLENYTDVVEYDANNDWIHPDIAKKYGKFIKEMVELRADTQKYNL